jgi:hypothetical protein
LQATIRNRNIGIVLGFQDQQQLQKVYTQHEAEVLFTNTDTKVLFATGSAKTQQQISQMLGQETRVKKQVSSSGHISKQTYGAPLLSPGEIGTRIKEGEVLVIRNKRNPIIANTCDPGKYNAYEESYPPPSKPKKPIDPAIFEQVELAEQLEFSEEEANEQTTKYEKLWRAKMDAQEALQHAKNQGLAHSTIKTLEKQLEKAQAEYDKFVAPEPEPIHKGDQSEKELVLKPPKKPTPDQPAPKKPEETTDTATVIVTPKPPDPPAADDDDDPFKDMYGEEDDDPFTEMYDKEDKT